MKMLGTVKKLEKFKQKHIFQKTFNKLIRNKSIRRFSQATSEIFDISSNGASLLNRPGLLR